MTTNTIHDMAEKWWPIPLPDYKDCPPTVQALLRDPKVLGAQQFFQMMVAQENARAAQREAMQPKHFKRPVNRRRRHHH